MSDFLSDHLRDLGTAPGLVVCLGNENTALLPLCLEIGARHAVLAEPDPKVAARLQNTAQSQEPGATRITVIEAMIAASSGFGELATRSLPRFSGLRGITGLSTLFPSLRDTGAAEIETLDVTGLLAQLPDADGPAPRVLILGPNGEEQIILDALADQGALQGFDQVFLTLPELALFEGGPTAADLTTRLEEQGFERADCDTSDPDIPTCHFRLDRKALERTRTEELRQQELAQLTERNAALENEVETIRAKAATVQGAVQAAQHETEMARGEVETLQKELETARLDLEEARAHVKRAQDTTIATREDLETARTEAETAQGENAALQHQLETTQAEAKTAQDEITTLRSQLDTARAETKRAQNTTVATRNEVETLQQSLTLAIRTQTLRENDLRDLQDQYGALREQAAQGDALIARLSQHIGQAIDHLPQTRSTKARASKATPAKTTTSRRRAKTGGKTGSKSNG